MIGTEPLDSFEELAELLGQVMPPTATKEDFNNSGLEVIHWSMLVEYEKAGRIAPMCVDRVRLDFTFCLGINANLWSVPDLSRGL